MNSRTQVNDDNSSEKTSESSYTNLIKFYNQKYVQNHRFKHQMHKSKMKITVATILTITILVAFATLQVTQCQSQQQQRVREPLKDPFPGVSRDLASFCAARPSLSIDVASMVVHVKRNVSFNYKLYLFSADHVFQTGQVIPRDEFRIHSFPVKFKQLVDFWPTKVDTFQYNNSRLNSLYKVPSETFNLKQFLKPVLLNPTIIENRKQNSSRGKLKEEEKSELKETEAKNLQLKLQLPEDLHGDSLPGDPPGAATFISHDVARVMEHHRQVNSANSDSIHPYNENYNKHIEFDRDDQLSVSKSVHSVIHEGASSPTGSSSPQTPSNHHRASSSSSASTTTNSHQHKSSSSTSQPFNDEIIPVGSFSSFHVNLTYLVRKDFGQLEPEIVRLHIDASQFVVRELVLISDGVKNSSSYPQNEDYSFLQHRLIRDTNTRITAINQIYEDWITRNFYTIVYIQRKLSNGDDVEENNGHDESHSSLEERNDNVDKIMIVNDRLVFRGTSTALLGAEQLDYNVKAAAFITERNGLHYYLEFLTTGKFYLCAVDWTKRPFKMIDSKRFPIRATKTQLDNEELLLCPPSICYSNRPIDEIVSYGRLNSILDDNNDIITTENLKHLTILNNLATATINGTSNSTINKALIRSTNETLNLPVDLLGSHPVGSLNNLTNNLNNWNNTTAYYHLDSNSLRRMSIERQMKLLSLSSSKQLETRLHLRDWIWTLPRKIHKASQLNAALHSALEPINLKQLPANSKIWQANGNNNNNTTTTTRFEWHYELAKRNDIKVKQDTYGYVLTGHEIDASYRILNELYLISDNHVITINYTLINETVTSNQLLGDEFFGLSSTIIDPITGVFYDRYENQIFFFKGDRYIGYNYATKKPLDDFVLESPLSSMELDPIGVNLFSGGPLVSSLPVVGILGRQHEVDGIYHDYSSDFVYIFSGMKFYKFLASEFKNGTFKPEGQSLPRMQCINEHFLDGCHFDRAFPNPCTSDDDGDQTGATNDNEPFELLKNNNNNNNNDNKSNELDLGHREARKPAAGGSSRQEDGSKHQMAAASGGSEFFEQQQMKLRSIAARKPGLMNILKENSLLKVSPNFRPDESSSSSPPPEVMETGQPQTAEAEEIPQLPQQEPIKQRQQKTNKSQEALFVYLLVTMIVLTCLVSILLIFMLIYWSRAKNSCHRLNTSHAMPNSLSPSYVASGNYLSNQREHQALSTADAQQLAYGGRLMGSKKQLDCVKVMKGTNSQDIIKGSKDISSSSSSYDANSIDNSAL